MDDEIINQNNVVELIYNITSHIDTQFNKLNLIQNYDPDIIGININEKLYQNIYIFKYKLTDIKIFIENISTRYNDESNYELKLAIQFKTNETNYYTHYSLFNFLKEKIKEEHVYIDKTNEEYILHKHLFIIPFHLTSTYGLNWEKFIILLNDYFINLGNVCSVCNTNKDNIYSPNEDNIDFKLCYDMKCQDDFNCQYNPRRELKSYFINMPQKGILIYNLLHSIINSSRRKIIFEMPSFVKQPDLLKTYFNKTDSEYSEFHKYLENIIKYISSSCDSGSSGGSASIDECDDLLDDFILFKNFNIPYKFIKYFFYKLNKYDFQQCDINIKDCTIIETKYITCEDQDTIFKKEINDYAFHGSGLENWFNILVNGLQAGNAAKGTLVNANAYGGGIYVSDTPTYSVHYCASRGIVNDTGKIGTNNDNIVMGIFQVAEKLDTYKKTSSIYVVTNPQQLLLRYLVIINNKGANKTKIAQLIHSNFSSSNIKQIEEKTTLLTLKTTNKRLKKEWDSLYKKQKELNIIIKTDVYNIWNIQFSIDNLESDSNLYIQLKGKEIENIQLEITIPSRYPFEAPFIRVVYPRFKFMTGHITRGGSICMELLTNKGWMPTMSIEMLLVQISNLITTGEAELDPTNWNNKYTITEAKEAFARMIKSHGW